MKSVSKIVKGIRKILLKRWPEAESLLDKMLEKAAGDESYRIQFNYWAAKGSTLELRELATYFGQYNVSGTELAFPNAVNAIDTAVHLDRTTISSIFVGFQDDKVIDMKTGKIYLLKDESQVKTKATVTGDIWGSPTSRSIVLEKIRNDEELQDPELLPLSSGMDHNARIIDFMDTSGEWDY